MFRRILINGFAILIVFGIVLVSDFAIKDFLTRPSLFMEIHNWDEGDIKVYYDTGKGYNEMESQRCDVRDYRSQRIKVPFPENTLNLRVDIEGSDHSFASDKLKVGYFHWPFSFHLNPETFLPNAEMTIESNSSNGHEFVLVPGARDPFFQIPVDANFRDHLASSRHSLLIFIRMFQILSLMSLILLFIPNHEKTLLDR